MPGVDPEVHRTTAAPASCTAPRRSSSHRRRARRRRRRPSGSRRQRRRWCRGGSKSRRSTSSDPPDSTRATSSSRRRPADRLRRRDRAAPTRWAPTAMRGPCRHLVHPAHAQTKGLAHRRLATGGQLPAVARQVAGELDGVPMLRRHEAEQDRMASDEVVVADRGRQPTRRGVRAARVGEHPQRRRCRRCADVARRGGCRPALHGRAGRRVSGASAATRAPGRRSSKSTRAPAASARSSSTASRRSSASAASATFSRPTRQAAINRRAGGRGSRRESTDR